MTSGGFAIRRLSDGPLATDAAWSWGLRGLAATLVVAIVLSSPQLAVPWTAAPPTTRIQLLQGEFHWFSSALPRPSILGNSTWFIPVPSQLRFDGKLAVDDATSLHSFAMSSIGFAATFGTSGLVSGKPSAFGDELVVFAASDAISFRGFEFGIRESLTDGFVYAYSQYPIGTGSVLFHQHRLFSNDQLPHVYAITLFDGRMVFSVDGTTRIIETYPVAPPGDFHVVATAHRASAGWASSGIGLTLSDLEVGLSSVSG